MHCVIAVMLMETFDRLTRKEKYVWDVSYLKSFYVEEAILMLCVADIWSCETPYLYGPVELD